MRCTTLHCTVLHCAALHYTTLQCSSVQCTEQHYFVLHCTEPQCTQVYCTALQCINWADLHWTVCTALNFFRLFVILRTELHCTSLCCTVHCTSLQCTLLHHTAPYCTALHCTAQYYTILHWALSPSALTVDLAVAGQAIFTSLACFLLQHLDCPLCRQMFAWMRSEHFDVRDCILKFRDVLHGSRYFPYMVCFTWLCAFYELEISLILRMQCFIALACLILFSTTIIWECINLLGCNCYFIVAISLGGGDQAVFLVSCVQCAL